MASASRLDAPLPPRAHDPVRERPILFSGPMVRAILAGEKTQTRRVVRFSKRMDAFGLRPDTAFALDNGTDGYAVACEDFASQCDRYEECPYGLPGGRLWVRENWKCAWTLRHGHGLYLPADGAFVCYNGCCNAHPREPGYGWLTEHYGGDWRKEPLRPSIFMPRWASRPTLDVTAVRVERVQDISESDAEAEGCRAVRHMTTATDEYRALWDSLNAKRGYGWDVNPWVWVLSFSRVAAGHA